MDAKKLQQLQHANAQKKVPLAYQTNITDYRTSTRSPVFQQQQAALAYHQQQALLASAGYQQSPSATSSSGGGPLSPIDMQPQSNNKLLLKHSVGGNTSSSSHSSPYHQSSYTSGEQLYQSPTERTYLAAAGRLSTNSTGHNPATALQQQYQQLQQAKLQAQMQTQNEAVQHQQRTFAMRQALNPPVPQGHYHMSQSSSMASAITMQQQQQQQQQHLQQQQQHANSRAPPSTLNLPSQFQPATGPLKVHEKSQHHHHQRQTPSQQEQQVYAQQQLQLQLQLQHQQQLQQQHHQHQQQQQQQQQQQSQQHRLKSESQTPGSEQSPVYIQQNHPGHVVNQACQTQISAVKPGNVVVVQKTTPSSEDSSSKSPSHTSHDRKKNLMTMQALKSPITKRPPTSPVTISGWLYKQGSEGLKVWRKRWFVLADYCLYYYKGPEEEKLLGSVLLPSYKVSACSPENKVYRKYAFKCEHQNMRTYWLAAETGESMVQWVRALSAATLMQAPSSGESDQPSASSSLNHSGENSDSGIHTLQSQQSKGPLTPASDNGIAGQMAHGSGSHTQPLYANAPPKPRRINDGGYSSPSPEHSIENERKQQHHQQQHATSRHSGVMSPTLQQMQQQQYQQQQRGQQPQQHHAIYDTRTGNVSTALQLQQAQQQYSIDQLEAKLQQQMAMSADSNYMDLEEQIMRLHQQQQPQAQQGDDIYGDHRDLYMQKMVQHRYPTQFGLHGGNNERRTPDAYGRSKNRMFSDYEDIYNFTHGTGAPTSAQEALLQEAASYRRPLSPPSYDGSKHVPAMPSRYTPNHLESASSQQRARPAAAIVRPHSADFLEYEARESAGGVPSTSSTVKPDPVRAPRPKSSLDINRTPDSFYYSEASYAEKMRKSALYLQNPQPAAQPQQAGSYRTTTDFLSPAGGGMNTIGYENPYERAYKRNELLNETLAATAHSSASSMPRMSRSNTTTGMSVRSMHMQQSEPSTLDPTPTQSSTQVLSPTAQQQQLQQQHKIYPPTMSTQQIIQQNEQFLRSASARLPKRSGGFDDNEYNNASAATSPAQAPPAGRHTPQDGERKREESMKRLLEWKQRMLQSPLTRKGVQQGGSNMSAMSKLGSNPNILLASTAVASGAHYGPSGSGAQQQQQQPIEGGRGIQRSRSDVHANLGPAGYNSYSSDDEAGSKTIGRPAGRSSATPTTNTVATVSTANKSINQNDSNKRNTTELANVHIQQLKQLQQQQQQQQSQFTSQTDSTALTENTDEKSHPAIQTQVTPLPIKVLKPILKTSEKRAQEGGSVNFGDTVDTNLTPTSTLSQRGKLKLNLAALKAGSELAKEQTAESLMQDVLDEVPILPKKPAPKSPQITSYIPVYTPKILTTGLTPSKNYENVEITSGEEKIEDVAAAEVIDASTKEAAEVEIEEEPIKKISEEETPMLAKLKVFQKLQEAKQSQKAPEAMTEPANRLPIESETTPNVEASTYEPVAVNPINESTLSAYDENEDEDDDTACEYTDDDLDEALAAEADGEDDSTTTEVGISKDEASSIDQSSAQIYQNEPSTPTTQQIPSDEGHYLPMTPKKSDLNQSGTLTLVSMPDDTEEENAYVEMTKALQEEDSRSNYEVMCISPLGTALTCVSTKTKLLQIQSEPVYMELSAANAAAASVAPVVHSEDLPSSSGKSTLKKNKKGGDTLKKKAKKSSAERAQSKRKDLPDILKPSQSTLALGSDSSDADDESSKHADLKKMRSRSRFSLSDTFRPASYYLGASTPLANCAESSDSEIVSPPPIPSSPPPMEELKTEEIFSSENYDTVKRRDSSGGSKLNLSYEQLPKLHTSNTSLNRQKTETAFKCSRLSLPDQFSKLRHSGHFKPPHSATLHHERTLSDSNYSFQTDNSSNTSSDFDFYNKLKKTSPSFIATPGRYQSNSSLPQKYGLNAAPTGDSSETDSVEYRRRQGSDSELERQRSRRPLSEESISEIESLREKFEETVPHDLDTYLSHLQASDLYLYQNTTLEALNSAGAKDLLTQLIKPPAIFRNKGDEHFYGNIRFVSSTDSLQKLDVEGKESNASAALGAQCATPTSVEHEQLKFFTPLHSRNNSNISEQSAPYYYSELNSSREMLTTPTTLNNQRDVHAHGSNIAHIHNPIDVAASAVNINVDLLADKDQAIDSKNLYKMKTNVEKLSYRSGKILKAGEPFTHASTSSQALQLQRQLKLSNYQTNLHAPYSTNTTAIATELTTGHVIAVQPNVPLTAYTGAYGASGGDEAATAAGGGDTIGSVSGAAQKNTNVQQQLDSVVGRLSVGGVGTAEAVPGSGGTKSRVFEQSAKKRSAALSNVAQFSVLGAPVSGELLWEEDTLWRESLRRVSQRHARSLDDLDRIVSSPTTGILKREQPIANKPKLTREVTYVNDNVSQQLRATYKPRLSEPVKRGAQMLDDDDDDDDGDNDNDNDAHDDEPAEVSELSEGVEDLLNENDVYVQLMAERLEMTQDLGSDVYEVLREDTSSTLSHKSAEIDRETIRQWDSMSSGLMKNSGSNSNSENGNSCVSVSVGSAAPSVGSAVKSFMQQLNAHSCEDNGTRHQQQK